MAARHGFRLARMSVPALKPAGPPVSGPEMEGGDGSGERLFSLELLVESARVEPRLLPTPLPASGPFRPVVALRLLDFPTLLVCAPHATPGPLVPFGRGKSCLFKLRPDALKGLLRRSPLHALLLALPPTPGPARLLGSSSVFLAAAAEELLLGTGPGGGRGRFQLRDLMGETVGELELSYRLSSLGPPVQGHLEQGAAAEGPCARDQRHQKLPCPSARAADRKLSLELIPEGEEDQESAPGRGSQGALSSTGTDPEPPSVNSSGEDLSEDPEIETNGFCPPPMYYSRHADKSSSCPKSVAIVTARGSFSKEGISLPSVFPVAKGKPRTRQASSPLAITSEQFRKTLSQLPLLNALMVEISMLNNQPISPGPCTVHPQLAWLYQTTESTKTLTPTAKNVCSCQEDKKMVPHHKERGRSPSPKLKRNRPDHLKGISPLSPGKLFTRPVCIERPLSPEKINTKENSPPRRKLTYGLTNTLKLRFQRSGPGMLKTHEKREHRKKKLGDISFEKKGKNSLAKEKIPQGSPKRHPMSSGQFDEKTIPIQNAQINENIETLIESSVNRNSPTTTKKISSRISKKVGASGVKSRENAKWKGLFNISDSGFKETSLEVHLPRVLFQKTEAPKNKTEIGKYVEYDDYGSSDVYNNSQTNNFERSHEFKDSDSVVINSENTGYSEDFTSMDSSRVSLGASESSPESLPVHPDHIDSDSRNSRSFPAECISPVPRIHSPVSPAQTLKNTYDLKSNGKNKSIDFNRFDYESLARTLKKQLTVQERGRRNIQTLEDKQVSLNTNSNIAKNLSVEKSHTIRTSQVIPYLSSSVPILELSKLEGSKASEQEKADDCEMVDRTNRCKHISELIINKLPGYTM